MTPAIISTAQVAALARVQRPVVSMWRRRFVGSSHPFPSPLPLRGPSGATMFDAEQVASWLTVTGHGNNPEACADLALHASPRGQGKDLDLAQLSAVIGLLCLMSVTGDSLAGHPSAQLLDLADETDPDDELLYRELAAVTGQLPELATLARDLAEAAYSPAEAADQLVRQRLPPLLPGHPRATVSGELLAFVTTLAAAMLAALDTDQVQLPAGADAEPVHELVRRRGEERPLVVHAAVDDAPAARAARCLLTARRQLRHHPPDATRASVAVAMYPSSDSPSMTDRQILTAVEVLADGLSGNQLAMVLGPASALTERLTDVRSGRVRADLIRTGQVRAVVRLPRGLMLGRGREASALWVVGPPQHDAPAAEKRCYVGDLVDQQLELLAEDVAADVVATLGREVLGPEAGRRVWGAHIQPVLTRRLVTASGSLVEVAAPARPSGQTGEDVVVRLAEADSAVAVGLPHLVPAPDPTPSSRVALGSAITVGRVQVIPGLRVMPGDVRAGSGGRGGRRPFVSAGQLVTGEVSGESWVDPLDLGRYERAQVTEPGDVVFCTAPRPLAWVDHAGGTVVGYPARVLRSLDARLPPALIAHDINAQPAHARQWRRWSVREVPAELAPPTREALTRLATARRETQARLRALEEWERRFADAVTGGLLTIGKGS